MIQISLKDIVDDVLLLVRNNNISESEDLSRGQIIAWVRAYKARLYRERLDQLKEQAKSGSIDIEDMVDDFFIKRKETGPLELEDVPSDSDIPTFTKRTVDPLEGVFNDSEHSILAIHDQSGEAIQYMNHVRRHYNYFRKYTFGELTAYYKNGYIYVEGTSDQNKLRYIYVLAIYEEKDNMEDTEDTDMDESDVKVPGWMVPHIKELIMKNELAFMLNRPSDDSNNATLASVKPHGPQDDEE